VSAPGTDLGAKEPYEPQEALAQASRHAAHFANLLGSLAVRPGAGDADLVVAPFDTELFGHWWYEGVDFIADLYRRLHRFGGPRPTTASTHLAAHPAGAGIALAEGSWGADGNFSMWLNESTRWTWERLWTLEERFWTLAPGALSHDAAHAVLAQAARELLLLQSSDWQFIISTGAAGDYATTRFLGHAAALATLLDALEPAARDRLGAAAGTAERLRRRDDVFPNVLDSLAAVLEAPAATLR
jgi:1,4-alpha-glucan branching enzyme